MPKNLVQLVKASGGAGVATENFRDDVTGAGDGIGMLDYVISAWAFGNEPAPESSYNSGQVFAETVSFTQAVQAHNIKRTGDVVVVSGTGGNPAGSSVSVASNIVSADTGSGINVTVVSGINPSGITVGGDAWFDGLTEPDEPAGEDPEAIRFKAQVNGGAGSGSQTVQWSLQYNPDDGPFNDTLTRNQQATMNNRDAVIGDYEVEWHANSSYTSLHSNAAEFIWNQTTFDEDKTFWLRWRRAGEVSWTNFGAVDFVDPREAV